MVTLDSVFAGLEAEIEESGCPVATAPSVASHVDQSRRKTLDDLRLLERNGDVESHQFGERMVVWWPAEDSAQVAPVQPNTEQDVSPVPTERDEMVQETPEGPEYDDTDGAKSKHELSQQASQPDKQRGEQTPTERTENDAPESGGELPADIESALREFLEDRAPRSSHGKEIVVDVLKELRQNGPMRTADLQEAVYEGYEEHYEGPRNLWNSIGRYLDDIPGFTKPGYGEWGYAGDDEIRNQFEE